MTLRLPAHLVIRAAESADGNLPAAARAGGESALSLVAKWLAAQHPAAHQDFLAEFGAPLNLSLRPTAPLNGAPALPQATAGVASSQIEAPQSGWTRG